MSHIEGWISEATNLDMSMFDLLRGSIFVLIELSGAVVCDGCLELKWQCKETSKELLVTSSRSKLQMAGRLLSHRLGAIR